MKNYLFKFVVLCVLVTPLHAQGQSISGDVNNDGQVNISDVTLLINYVLTEDAESLNLLNADMNNDGVVNITDVTTLITYLLNGEQEQSNLTFDIDGVSFTMVFVKGGTFIMGTNQYGTLCAPAHEVTLSDYYVGQTEVTQGLWLKVMGYNPSYFTPANGYPEDLMRPVDEITWFDCQDFIIKLNKLTGRTFRLLTEAEFEFAARGGNKSQGYLYAGSNDIGEVAWYHDNLPEPFTEGWCISPVGLKKPNELGIYDMAGNACEWCYDKHADNMEPYPSEPQVNPTGPSTGNKRLIRGGSIGSDGFNNIVFIRNWDWPGTYGISLGLRLALSDD